MNQPEKTNREGSVELLTLAQAADVTIQPLAQRSMFWRPAWLQDSAWLEHIPFAFWLMEAHEPRLFVELGTGRGVSYFAFCQAVEKLGLDTRCFAVDTWQKDEQGGFGDENVFERVRGHNEAQFSGFSRLVRSTFDEALAYFADGAIDLLHLDGSPGYEAVSRDFERWIPKLSGRAIVVLHGTGVRERGWGVCRFFEELKQRYPAFEFPHGQGLGVVQVGPEQDELLQRLFKAGTREAASRAVHEVFSRLGRGCADTFLARQQEERARTLAGEVETHRQELETLRLDLERTETDLGARSRELADTRSRMQTLLEQAAVERGQLAERVALLQEIRGELKEEIGRHQARLDGVSGEFGRRLAELTDKLNAQDAELFRRRALAEEAAAEVERLKTQLNRQAEELLGARANEQSFAGRLAQLTEDLARRGEEMAAACASAEEAQRKYMLLHQQSVAREGDIALLRRQHQELAAEAGELRETLAAREERLAAALADLRTRDTELAELGDENAGQAEALERVKARLAQAEEARQQLEQQILSLMAEKQELAEYNDELFQERTRLSGLLEERNIRLQAMAEEAAARQARVETLETGLNGKGAALQAAEKQLAEVTAQAALLQAEKETALATWEGEREQLEGARQEQTRKLRSRIDELETENRKLKDEQEPLTRQLNDRFEELAILTRLLEERETALQEKEKTGADQAQKDAALARLEAENMKLQREQQIHAGTLAERDHELTALKGQLEKIRAGLQTKEMEAAAQQQRAARLEGELKAKTDALQAREKELADARAQAAAGATQKDAAVARVETENRKLAGEKKELSGKLDDRLKEVEALKKRLEECAAALQGAEKQLADARNQAAAVQAQKDAALARMEGENRKLRAEQQVLTRKLDERFKELATLTRLLEEGDCSPAVEGPKEEKESAVRKEVSASGPLTAPLRDFIDTMTLARGVKAQMAIIEKSGLFDKEWYLRQNPDIAQAGANPLKHYIRFGAAEGRNPGPNFDTSLYLARHPEVAKQGINPLVHFIQSKNASLK